MNKLMPIILSIVLLYSSFVFAEEYKYSYLEDMSLSELMSLDKEIHKLLDKLNNSDSLYIDVYGKYYDECGYGINYIYIIPWGDTEGEISINDNFETESYVYKIESGFLNYTTDYGDYKFEIYEDCLIPYEYNYEGFIPDADSFNASIYYLNKYVSDKYSFNEDGSFKNVYINRFENDEMNTYFGTYEKFGNNILILNYDIGSTKTFYIKDGIANDSVYRKMDK